MKSNENQFLILLRGIPGSGKTHLTNALSDRLSFEIIDPDLIFPYTKNFISFRKEGPINLRLKNLKYRYNLKRVVMLLKKGSSVIWEQPWRKILGIDTSLRNIALKFKYDKKDVWNHEIDILIAALPFKVIFIELISDPELAWKRCKRKHLYKSKSYFYKNFIAKTEKFNLNTKHYIQFDNSINERMLVNKIEKLLTT